MTLFLLGGITNPDKVIEGAKKLSSLDSCTIWSLLCIILSLALIYVVKLYSADRNRAIDARLEEAKADIEMANAVEKLAEQLKELRYSLKGS